MQSHLPVFKRQQATAINSTITLDSVSVGGRKLDESAVPTSPSADSGSTMPLTASATASSSSTIASASTSATSLPTAFVRRKSIKTLVTGATATPTPPQTPAHAPVSMRTRQQSISSSSLSLHLSAGAKGETGSVSGEAVGGGWNSSKIIHEKLPSESLKRSKSYASSLKKNRAGNVINGKDDDSSSANGNSTSNGADVNYSNSNGPEFVNGQHRTTRALAARVTELETLLDAAHQDLSNANALIESIESDHRFHLDELKLDMKALTEEKDTSILTVQRDLGGKIEFLESQVQDLQLKSSTQMSEIEKLIAKNVAAVQASAETEIEVVSLRSEREVWKSQVKVLQAEILKMQLEAHKVAERELESEVKYEANLAEASKEIDGLKKVLESERLKHDSYLKNTESKFVEKDAAANDLMKEITLLVSSFLFG
ncbi:hypothetical protein HK100_000935 [Physocladia obscura]|uniref:Uncharacterized protein n=1 Tax=Physocladia obscura TaxID=109957 RepID=A0AAD5XF81_9FUNG|nr:hypothetical protein HK100_000935 [Physocladia obscura]